MKGCLRSIIVFVFIVILINKIIDFLDPPIRNFDSPSFDEKCDEGYSDSLSFPTRTHQRFWSFKEQRETYCMQYHSQEDINSSEALSRLNMGATLSEDNFWGAIYQQLIEQTEDKVDYLADSLIMIAKRKEYSKMDLARLTVSFVQDIPYSFITPMDCSEVENEGKPCVGNIPYGIISPYEFVHTQHGDCDTRSVLLFILLEKMNFEPMIVVSDEYAHAMLALNMPAQGDFISHAGRKYYFWETTNVGWSIGMLPPNTHNVNYWKIALVNES